MKFSFTSVFLSCILVLSLSSCTPTPSPHYIFFLHNRFLEEHELTDSHPEYGRVEYNEIITAFQKNGFQVISEIRNGNVNVRDYANGNVNQIDSLLASGTKPQNITVIGTSKGGYIAQYVSTQAANPELNFVFIGCFQESDIEEIPDINFCGNILTIYDKSDPYGVSAIARKENSTCQITHFKEVELNTGLKHGFLYKALDEWMDPAIKWARRNYN
jgi:hypothetical protein